MISLGFATVPPSSGPSPASLIFAGAVAFTRLPLATKTRVELPRLTVTAIWPGASAELIEIVPHLADRVRDPGRARRAARPAASRASAAASITVELDPDADVADDAARDPRAARAAPAPSFPPGATPPSVSQLRAGGARRAAAARVHRHRAVHAGHARQDLTEDSRAAARARSRASRASPRSGGAETGISVTYDRDSGCGSSASPRGAGDRRARRAAWWTRWARSSAALIGVAGHRCATSPHVDRGPGEAAGPRPGRAGLRARRAGRRSGRKKTPGDASTGSTASPAVVDRRDAGWPDADAIKTAARIQRALAELQPSLPPGVRFRLAVGRERGARASS